MTKGTATREWTSETTGKAMQIVATITREVSEKTANLDGDIINLGKEATEYMSIIIKVDGKVWEYTRSAPYAITRQLYGKEYDRMTAKGIYARFGDKYIGQDLYNLVMEVIAEADAQITTTEEYAEIKAEEAKAEARKDEAVRKAAERYQEQLKNGLCQKCGSYCYGDCQA